jgi:hypothetical protein
LSLRIVEVSGHSDDRVFDISSQVCLCCVVVRGKERGESERRKKERRSEKGRH